MRKAEIIRRLAETLNLSQVKAEEAIEAILAELKETLQAGESIPYGRAYLSRQRSQSAAR